MNRQFFYTLGTFFLGILFVASCKNSKDVKGMAENYDKVLVINEVMASNHTGILAENDSLYDWIEIKNVSAESIDLSDYALATLKKVKSKEDSTEVMKTDRWKLPEMELAPGELLLVFASNRDIKEEGKELHTDFKISNKNGCVQVLSADGYIMSEVKFDRLESDECYRRLDDGSYEKSFCQSPGFENTQEGYESFNELIDTQRKSPLLIWEAHTKSSHNVRPWVEVKNVSNSPVKLSEYGLSSDPYDDAAWQLPDEELEPGKTLAIECHKDSVDIKGSKSIALMKDGQMVDGICCMMAPFGVSMGRVNGQKGFFFFPSPSRGADNEGSHYRFIAEQPTPSFKPGVYQQQGGMDISLDAQGRTIHYTLDGSTPTMGSRVYSNPIHIDTTTVIRAFCEGDTLCMRSKTLTATYFLNVKHTLPIINISVNSNELFDEKTGIYMPGPGGGGSYPFKGANYWKKVSKPAHVEFYENDSTGGSFSLDCGLAIFGGFSRTLAKKSFKVQFKDIYGPDRLYYDVFNEGKAQKHKNLVFRSGSQDMKGVMVRDEFFTSLVKANSPSLLVQAYRPVALYINARYFGLYYIREKIDRHFVARHLNVPNDSINIIMSLVYNEEGPKMYFQEMMNYVKSNDLTKKEHFDHMRNLVDFNGLIDQKLGQIYSGNTDVGNIRYVRSTSEKSDKKWYYVFYDVDLSWVTDKPTAFYLRENTTGGVGFHNIVIDKLLDNNEFRQLFLERLSMHLHKTFTPENATKVFDGLIKTIEPEMKLNCKRWPNLGSYERWQKNVDAFKKKFKGRDKYVLDGIRNELKVTPEENKKYFGDLGY